MASSEGNSWIAEPKLEELPLKVKSAILLLVFFGSLKDSTCETRNKCFLFHFKSSFCSQENQILEF